MSNISTLTKTFFYLRSLGLFAKVMRKVNNKSRVSHGKSSFLTEIR